MKRLAAQLKDASDLIFFGRGYNYSTALEAALKVCCWGVVCGCVGRLRLVSRWWRPYLTLSGPLTCGGNTAHVQGGQIQGGRALPGSS
jgi:hypothetical protein